MRTRILVITLVVFLASCLEIKTASAFAQKTPIRRNKDISAIGHRDIAGGKGVDNWYSLDQEKEMGKRHSAATEQSSRILHDPAVTEYVTRVAENVAKNSDTQMPITVRLIDSDQVEAFTLPGGYQYITRGLLLKLDNESELASVLARGIAHTALRSFTRLLVYEQYAKIGTLPLIFGPESTQASSSAGFGLPIAMLKFRRDFEAAADYFGVQYVYKAGYSAESFPQVVQKIWPATAVAGKAFNSFPPTSERIKVLQDEIIEIMPKRDREIISTPEFADFKMRLQSWKLPVQNSK